MKSVIRIVGILAASLLISGSILAAGLGELSVSSALGQPLQAEIKLLSIPQEDIGSVQVSLASPMAYSQAHIQRSPVLSELHFSIQKTTGGAPVVRITSTDPIGDPFVDLLVELNWSSGRVLREYTILLDPPKTQTATSQQMMAPVGTVAGKTAAQPPAAQAQPPKAKHMAARPAAKSAGQAARSYGPVKSGETLHSIASKLLPPDVSMNMMLASLYHANQDAFIQHNMNLLKKGQVLKVPSRDQIMILYSPHQANQLVHKQAIAWREIKNRLAGQAVVTKVPEVKGRSAETGKIVQATPEKKPAAQPEGKDVLKLSKGESAKSLNDANKRIQNLEEELTSKNLALKDAQSRVAELEKTVQDLQRLTALKAKQEAAAGPAATPPAKHTVKPAVKPPVTPPASTEKSGFFSFLLENPLYIVGALAVLVLLGVLWVFLAGSRRRKGLTDFEQSIMTGGDQFKTSIFRTDGSAGDRSAITQSGASTDFSRLGLGSIDTHEVDPIAEAEVYMAYGRDAQAEEILKEAQAKEPQRHEIALKLLEIYAARRDTASFETQASELYANLGDPAHSVWQKAAEMGRKIDPDNPLYHVFDGSQQPSEEVAESIEPVSEVPAVPEEPVEEAPEEPAEEPAEGALEEEPIEMEEHAEAIPSVESEVEAEPEGLDFELPEQTEEEEKPSEPVAEEAATALDFDTENALDFEPEAEIEAAPEAPEPVVEETEGVTEFPSFGKTDELDLRNIEEIDISAMPPPTKEAEAAEEIELEDIQPPVMEPEAEPAEELPEAQAPEEPEAESTTDEDKEAVTLPDLDFSGIDLELSEPTETPAEPALAEPAQEVEAPPVIDQDLLEEVNTKLDLAKAYLEMGDKEGAREILDEVLKEGDDQQQKAANELIAEIG